MTEKLQAVVSFSWQVLALPSLPPKAYTAVDKSSSQIVETRALGLSHQVSLKGGYVDASHSTFNDFQGNQINNINVIHNSDINLRTCCSPHIESVLKSISFQTINSFDGYLLQIHLQTTMKHARSVFERQACGSSRARYSPNGRQPPIHCFGCMDNVCSRE